MMRRWAILLFVLACALALLDHARGHDATHAGMTGEWIGRMNLRDPILKYSCCGNMDCRPLPEVEDRMGGVRVPSGEVIEQRRVIRMATPDGGWWGCEFLNNMEYRAPSGEVRTHRKGELRCLIGPGHGS